MLTLEFTEEEGVAFMKIYQVGLAVLAMQEGRAFEMRRVILDHRDEVQLPARRLMKRLAYTINPTAAAHAEELTRARYPGRGWGSEAN